MIKRLRWKFVCINMVIVTMMLVIIFSMLLHITRKNLELQSVRALNFASEDHKRPGRPGEKPDEVMMPFFAVHIGQDGSTRFSGSEYFDLSDEETVETLIRLAQESGEKTGVIKAYKLRFTSFQTPDGQKIVFVDISGEMQTLRGLLKTCVIIGILSFSAFLYISIYLAHWAIRPVEQAWEQQKQFVADASHELKTPLTVITTNAELLQDPSYSAQENSRFAENILVMSRQMRGLVESLLELARVDNGTSGMVMERVNFSETVCTSVMVFDPVCFEKGLALESDLAEGMYVKGSVSHLQQVAEILLDNAVKYASPGGTLTVTLTRQGNHCLLHVSNPGQPLSEEERKNVFKRFYRADPVRRMEGSYGLGLSIAQSIVESHGGKIWAESSGGLNTFCVKLSLLQQSI